MAGPLLPALGMANGPDCLEECGCTALAKQTLAPLSTDPKTTTTTDKPEADNLARMSPALRRAYIRLRDKQRKPAPSTD
ncbi:MAG TPA: hypothetical protein VEI97_05405 [bacterium]|nr:hypothetical protein [bacterium]